MRMRPPRPSNEVREASNRIRVPENSRFHDTMHVNGRPVGWSKFYLVYVSTLQTLDALLCGGSQTVTCYPLYTLHVHV